MGSAYLSLNHDRLFDFTPFDGFEERYRLAKSLVEEAEPGLTLLVGPPGSGKSTFMRMLGSEGRVEYISEHHGTMIYYRLARPRGVLTFAVNLDTLRGLDLERTVIDPPVRSYLLKPAIRNLGKLYEEKGVPLIVVTEAPEPSRGVRKVELPGLSKREIVDFLMRKKEVLPRGMRDDEFLYHLADMSRGDLELALLTLEYYMSSGEDSVDYDMLSSAFKRSVKALLKANIKNMSEKFLKVLSAVFWALEEYGEANTGLIYDYVKKEISLRRMTAHIWVGSKIGLYEAEVVHRGSYGCTKIIKNPILPPQDLSLLPIPFSLYPLDPLPLQ